MHGPNRETGCYFSLRSLFHQFRSLLRHFRSLVRQLQNLLCLRLCMLHTFDGFLRDRPILHLLHYVLCSIMSMNNFSSVPADICNLPSDIGPCLDALYPYYFNSATGQCEEFLWGGCEGNANRFDTIEECEDTCLPRLPRCLCDL